MFKVHLERDIQAAHKLEDTDNLKTKRCSNLHGHGYQIVIDMDVNTLLPNGMTIDFAVLKKVLDKYDHGYLNDFIEPSTTENLVFTLCKDLFIIAREEGSSVYSLSVKASETGKNWIEHEMTHSEFLQLNV